MRDEMRLEFERTRLSLTVQPRRSSLEAVTAQSRAMVQAAWDKAADPDSADIGAAGGLMTTTRAQQSGGGTETAAEQLRHYSGRVYAAIRPIAARIAGQPFRVGVKRKPGAKLKGARRATAAQLPDFVKGLGCDLDLLATHPVLELLADPNPWMTGNTLKAVTVIQLELTGKAFWWLVPPAHGSAEPRQRVGVERDYAAGWQIWPLPPSWVEPIHAPGKPFAGWKVKPYGDISRAWEVSAEDMAFFAQPDPSDPFGAHSPLQANARAVVANESVSEAQRRTFHNPLPGLAVHIGRHPDAQDSATPGQRPMLSGAQRRQIDEWINSAYAGLTKFGKPLIIDALIEKVEQLAKSPREMDFMRSGDMTERQIDEGFGTNPVIMGRVEQLSRASSAVAESHFLANTVNPIISLISETATGWLSPRLAPGEEVYVFIEAAVAVDADLELQRVKETVAAGVATQNEVRRMLGLGPKRGGDDMLVTPQGLFPVDDPTGVASLGDPDVILGSGRARVE